MYQIVKSLGGSECVRKKEADGVVLLIPVDEANTDYQRYLEWLNAGNEPEVVAG